MSHKGSLYKEELLHHFWQNQIFAQNELFTECGLEVSILNPGRLNHVDGPDFLNAKIRIGKLMHYGAVEIHKKSKDWFVHKHHLDRNYEKVILHVVADNHTITPARTIGGTNPPTLNVIHALPNNLQPLVQNLDNSSLPCSGLIHLLSPEVFKQQIEKAHQEYLDHKVDTFFQYFDEHLIPSLAWKNALFITLCDGLGVPSNRDQMKELAGLILNFFKEKRVVSNDATTNLKSVLLSEVNWNRKGMRLSVHPEKRITQALKLYQFIQAQSLGYFLIPSPFDTWYAVLNACNLKHTPHNKRLYISFFLPAMYALSIITHSDKLKQEITCAWNLSTVKIPDSILRKFGIFESISDSKTMKRIGLVHQFNAYCKPKHCSQCEVLNKAISC